MTYRQAALYAKKDIEVIKNEFEHTLEGLREIGHKTIELSPFLIDFWLHGSIPINYDIYMTQLDAEGLLKSVGIPSDMILGYIQANSPIDHYVLFKNACLHFMGEELTDDFKSLVVDPIKKQVDKVLEARQARKDYINQARELIRNAEESINNTITSIRAIEAHYLAGTIEETIVNKLEQVSYLIKNRINEV